MSLANLIPSVLCRNNVEASKAETRNSEHGPAQKPWHEIQETAEAWALTVNLPGVSKDDLEFLVDDTQVRVFAKKAWKQPEGWTSLYRESNDLAYELLITHENAIDADRIHAELKDGVLQASLPKSAAIKPRKVTIS